MGDFLASLFGGQNKTLNTDINKIGSLAGYSTGIGQGDTTAASNYFQDILKGGGTQALAPAISAGQQQGQQEKNNLAQFGTRSGGTASAAAGIDANTRANLINLLGGQLSGAAQNLGSLGTTNLGLAQQGTMSEAQLAQERFK